MEFVQTLEPGEFTLADLDALPADGMQYELVDGMLLVTPAPTVQHQTAVVELAFLLRLGCPDDLRVYVSPLDFRPTARRSLQPDVMVARRDDTGPRALSKPLLLAAEVLSPATRSKDLLLKRALYEEAGVASYWIFDPASQELTVLELKESRYVERAVVRGDEPFSATLPFPVEVVPSTLIR
jgi:Uma2 family endonuclease